MTDRTRLLFVGHEATRTGAPIALLNLLRWFRENANFDFSLLLCRGGELEPEYRAICNTIRLGSSPWLDGRRARWLRRFRLSDMGMRAYVREVREMCLKPSPGLVYFNSVASAPAADVLRWTGPSIWHVHELKLNFSEYISEEDDVTFQGASRYIACSEAVKRDLIASVGVSTQRIVTIPAFISTAGGGLSSANERMGVREELRIPEGALVVGGCGLNSWRKGGDLFVQLAREIISRARELLVYFIWVGGNAADISHMRYDAQLLAIDHRFRFPGIRSNPLDIFAIYDVFALTSREEPFGMVGLEAASTGVPVVCFDRAGGMPEFVEHDCGRIVPYLDVGAMADGVAELLLNDELRASLGECARKKVKQRHDLSVAAARVSQIIRETLAVGGRQRCARRK